MWASIGLFVSMVCLVLLLAKLIKSIALSVWNTTQKMKLYVEAVSWTGLVNGWYNIVTFLCAFDWFILLGNIRRRWFISLVYC
jgi:hypothetical protein